MRLATIAKRRDRKLLRSLPTPQEVLDNEKNDFSGIFEWPEEAVAAKEILELNIHNKNWDRPAFFSDVKEKEGMRSLIRKGYLCIDENWSYQVSVAFVKAMGRIK